MKRLLVLIPTACILWTTASQASENLITNGGFENPYPAFQTHYPPGSDLGGWLVGGVGNVLHYWGPNVNQEGDQYLYMPYTEREISQPVTLSPGRSYELQLYAAATVGYSSQLEIVSSYPVDTLQDSYVVGSANIARPYHPPDFVSPQWVWEQHSFIFTARADQERLSFRSGEMALDGISLVELPVPEPSSLALVGLTVVGLAAFARRLPRRLFAAR